VKAPQPANEPVLTPKTREKTFSGKHYTKDDHIVWQQALGKRGWLA
jgi:hypothetical protein